MSHNSGSPFDIYWGSSTVTVKFIVKVTKTHVT